MITADVSMLDSRSALQPLIIVLLLVALPWDPLQMLFGNNVAYHDIHHQQFGIKKNFSQPYFTHWDTILDTRMTAEQVPRRHREKYNAGPCKVISVADVPGLVEEKKEQ